MLKEYYWKTHKVMSQIIRGCLGVNVLEVLRKFSRECLVNVTILITILSLGSLSGIVYRSPKLSPCLQPSTSKKTRLKIFQAFPSYHFPSFSSCIHLRYGLTKLPCFCILTRGCEKHAMQIDWLRPLERPTPERRVLVGHGCNLICCRLRGTFTSPGALPLPRLQHSFCQSRQALQCYHF